MKNASLFHTRVLRHAAVFAALVTLAACKSPPAGVSAAIPAASAVALQTAPAPPPSVAAPARPTLAEEQRRLAALFRGTPVVFEMQPDGSLRVDVPLRFCFEPGQTMVKPALVAVLDRVAQSQHDGTSRIVVSAAADGPVKPTPAASSASAKGGAASDSLGMQRAASVRDRLAGQGVAAARLTLAAGGPAGVRLLVGEPPSP